MEIGVSPKEELIFIAVSTFLNCTGICVRLLCINRYSYEKKVLLISSCKPSAATQCCTAYGALVGWQSNFHTSTAAAKLLIKSVN
jgi:hypothetical protein